MVALLKTFGIESIATILHRAGSFAKDPNKRIDRTDRIFANLVDYGIDSERGRVAIQAMNDRHDSIRKETGAISNEDSLYVLSGLICEAERWIARFGSGQRQMSDAEKESLFLFWKAVATRMHIHSIPDSYSKIVEFNERYEKRYLRPNPMSETLFKKVLSALPHGNVWRPFYARNNSGLLGFTGHIGFNGSSISQARLSCSDHEIVFAQNHRTLAWTKASGN